MRQVTDADLKFFWAAYKDGTWSDLIYGGLDPASFTEAMTDMMGAVGFDWVLEVGGKPIGLVLGRTLAAGRVLEPQVDWMPWATMRNKMEGIAVFLREVGKLFKIFVFATEADKPFYERFCRYRLLRRGCIVTKHFGPDAHGYFFYTPGPD